jgi:hypothetical protein
MGFFKKCRSSYFYGKYCSYRGLVKANLKCDKLNWHESIDNNLWANPTDFWKGVPSFKKKKKNGKNLNELETKGNRLT